MRVKFESDILKPEVRKRIIEEIEGRENKLRKYQAYKRYQCYKDKTHHYVVEHLLNQLDQATVEEMRYALSNISIVRKVIDKLARVYSNGVERIISGDEGATKKLKTLEKALDFNSCMKKTNRLLKLEKNVDVFVKPTPKYNADGSQVTWEPSIEVLPPYLYDVVEDFYDRDDALCVILSDYNPPRTALDDIDGKRGPSYLGNLNQVGLNQSDGSDQTIADAPQDQNSNPENSQKLYVFWSKNYHFTCNQHGEIVQDPKNPDNVNPLGVFNHINFAIDQDGSFWATGGDDLIDGAILINALVTHTMHVGIVQGYGQFYMTGENLPRGVKVGPTNAIIAEYKKDEQAEPKMGFLNANPQLDSLRGLIEMYVALYLTTNNLSTSGVSTQLSGGTSMPSGIALIIDKAESLEDVQDQRQIFLDNEPDIWKAVNAILEVYGEENLEDEYQGLVLPEGFEENLTIKFHDATPIMTEQEKLDNLKRRKELGIDSMVSILMKDDPSLDEKQAEEKLQKLIEQRLQEKLLETAAMKEAGVEYEDPNQPQNGSNQPQNEGMVDNPNPATRKRFPKVSQQTADDYLNENKQD